MSLLRPTVALSAILLFHFAAATIFRLRSFTRHHGVNRGARNQSDTRIEHRHNTISLGWGLTKDLQRNRVLGHVARRSLLASIRGGEVKDPNDDKSTEEESTEPTMGRNKRSKKKHDNDDERYSRQMYALGARAHGLVRSTTAILDGPMGRMGRVKDSAIVKGEEHGFRSLNDDERQKDVDGNDVPSGLLYEVAKNLALSGVGRIILVRNDENFDAGYFDGLLDDLGAAYRRAALSEIFPTQQSDDAIKTRHEYDLEVEDEDYSDELDNHGNDGTLLLAEYIQRLNPGVQVDILSRTKLLELLRGESAPDEEDWDDESVTLGSNPVMVCIDRSISVMLEVNNACRHRCHSNSPAVPFVSVKTAGVYSQLFCDFGPSFMVVDEDGETPRSTLVEKVERSDENGTVLTINCLDGERHDVSSGDAIEFQAENISGDIDTSLVFPECEVVSVKSPTCFTFRERTNNAEESALSTLLEGKIRSFTRVKIPHTISFSSLRSILHPESSTSENNDNAGKKTDCWDNDALFAPSDLDKSFDPLRRKAIMSSMAALDKFVAKYGKLPCRFNADDSTKSKRSDMERFLVLVRKVAKTEPTETFDTITSQFAQTCRAKFTPIQAVSGAVAAQEVLKAATGLYNPVKQFLLYDCDEVLHSSNDESNDTAGDVVEIARGQAYIIGEELSKKIASSRIFLVGAGAIGCELLKNLAAMGAGTYQSDTKQGCLIVTDMDTIEKSNLSRQLLFRDHDVGDFKSAAARTAVLRFLPGCQIEAHTSRVGEEEDGPFDDDFWSAGCDVVLNALDNVEARLFVDGQCVSNGRGLIDAGTLGPKGNVQVVVPFKSESYGSSVDPPEPDIPVCTLKNFPYDISHTIQWARDLFDGYFHRRPRQANDHVKEIAQMEDLSDFAHMLIRKFGDDAALDMADELGEDIGVFPFSVGLDQDDPEYIAAVRRVALNWAIRQADRFFYSNIDELLQKHPTDSLDEDGVPFWTGSRRVPTPLKFQSLNSGDDEVSAQQVMINEKIAQFVQTAARLRMESFLSPKYASQDYSSSSLITLEDALSCLEENASIPRNEKDSDSDKNDDDVHAVVLEKLNGAKTGASFLPQLNLVDFEKDDEANGHVSFVTAASNLRAMAYGIPAADAMETRRVAGRIVPAMITTTGLVSALSSLELIKMIRGLSLEAHRNAFVNLALPFFASTIPLPAEEVASINGNSYTMWDRIVVKASNKMHTDELTLRTFIEKVKQSSGLGEDMEVSNISYGPYMIYANFLNSDDDDLLNSPLMEAVKNAAISDDGLDDLDLDEGSEDANATERSITGEDQAILSKLSKKRHIDFTVAIECTETGEEYELPPIRLVKEKGIN